jgi:hypothetical protein
LEEIEMKKYRLLYDVTLMRPGCVLLQAMAGGTVDGLTLQCIGEWLLAPTPDMKLYTATDELLDMLVEHHKGKEAAVRINGVRRKENNGRKQESP